MFLKFLLNINIILNWGLGIGDWGLGIGDWAQSPIPNPLEKVFIILNILLKVYYIKHFNI